MLFDFKTYVTLEANGKSNLCIQSIMDKNWGMHKHLSALMVFSKKDINGKPITLTNTKLKIKDFGLNTGTVFFDLAQLNLNT